MSFMARWPGACAICGRPYVIGEDWLARCEVLEAVVHEACEIAHHSRSFSEIIIRHLLARLGEHDDPVVRVKASEIADELGLA